MSALATWLSRWQPLVIHSAILTVEHFSGGGGGSARRHCGSHVYPLARVGGASARLHQEGKPGITAEEYQPVSRRLSVPRPE